MNIFVTAFASAANGFGHRDRRFAENLRVYHAHIRENDICMTHTLVDPQVDRSKPVELAFRRLGLMLSGRQKLYERYYSGDRVRLAGTLSGLYAPTSTGFGAARRSRDKVDLSQWRVGGADAKDTADVSLALAALLLRRTRISQCLFSRPAQSTS